MKQHSILPPQVLPQIDQSIINRYPIYLQHNLPKKTLPLLPSRFQLLDRVINGELVLRVLFLRPEWTHHLIFPDRASRALVMSFSASVLSAMKLITLA